MRRISIFTLLCFLYAFFPGLSLGADVREICATYSAVDVTVVTTAETVVATSEACKVPSPTFKAVVKVDFTITTGAASATYQVRIRRTNLTGTLIGDEIARTIQVAAAGVEQVSYAVTDERTADLSTVVYVATIEIASASGNSTVGEAFIEVILL